MLANGRLLLRFEGSCAYDIAYFCWIVRCRGSSIGCAGRCAAPDVD